MRPDLERTVSVYRVSTKERNLSNVIPVQKHCVLSWTPGISHRQFTVDCIAMSGTFSLCDYYTEKDFLVPL